MRSGQNKWADRTIPKRCSLVVLCFIVVLLFLIFPKTSEADWPKDLIDDPNNPIFDPLPDERIYYPSIIYDADGFGNGASGPFYKMWFSDGVSGIGTATSNDGITWTEGADCTGLTNAHHASVLYDVNGFGNVATGPRYKIWYWDTANLYGIAAIRTATSNDGTTWTNDQALTQDISKPIVSGLANNWNRGSYGPIHLFYQPNAANSGTDPFDYEYVMYYDATTGGFEQIGLGYSADGIDWTRYGDDPVFPCGLDWTVPSNWGEPEPWDSSYATFGSVIRDSDGFFHLFYSGGTTASNQGIGYATSDDGITWVRDAGNPYIETEADTWHSQRAYTPSVTYDDDRYSEHGDNTKFKLWYSGRDDTGNFHLGYQGILIGTSTISKGTASSDPACLEESSDYIMPVLQLIIDIDSIEEMTLEELRVRLSGTGVDTSSIKSLLLYKDLNPNGNIDSDDVLIAEVTVENADVEFASLDQNVAASSSAFWLIAAMFSTSAERNLAVQAEIASSDDLIGFGAISDQMIVSMAAPIEGGIYSLSICDPGPGPGPGPDPELLMLSGGGSCICNLSGVSTTGATSVVLHLLFWIIILLGARLLLKPSRSSGFF